MSCKSVADWLHRDVENLDEAQRLVLDDHLATCESCRGDRERMQRVRAIGQSLEVPGPGAREYNRAIARALLEGKRETREEKRGAKRIRWIVPALAFAGVAAAATVASVVVSREAPAPPHLTQPEPEPEPEPVLPSDPESSPSPSPSTSHDPTPTPTPTPPPAPAPTHHRGSPTPTPTLTTRQTAAELLERARREFAAKDYAASETTANLALAAKPSRALNAEIHMLLAEIAQASGKPDLAIARYSVVTHSFAGTDAAESALYASARVELRRRDTAAARTLLDRYLARYPTGRFADDARRELAALP